METSDLYRMIETLLEMGTRASSSTPSQSLTGQTVEALVRAPALPALEPLAAKTNSTQSEKSGMGETITNTLLGGVPLLSLFKGLFDLGGEDEIVPSLVKHQMPVAINETAGYSASAGFVPLDYAQSGLPRTPAAQTQQVTVQVNAMDSRSFLDHSDEIANAVREALLNSHSLRDVLTEL